VPRAARAFQNNAFVGDRYERGTVEARTGGVHLWSVDWGLALFYDVGRVYYDDQGSSPLLQDAGLGLRIQLVGAFSSLLRLDGAYAISGAPDRSSLVPHPTISRHSGTAAAAMLT
jgi:hemolysin activation/secretion protein